MAVVSVIVALAALIGLFALISSRDRSTFSGPQGPGAHLPDAGDRHLPPGSPDPAYATQPPTSGAHVVAPVARDDVALSNDQLLTALEQGNVVLVYGDAAQARALRALASDVAGAFDPALALAGQAVILDRAPRLAAGRVLALAWRHQLSAASPSDAALRAFAQYWLGRGASTGH